jgi:phage terminase small subunit
MPALSNARHERFAQELAKGLSQVEAYRIAGFQPHDSAAARLFGNVRVQERLAEILGKAAVRAEITAADIAKQLDEDRDFARECATPAAMVAATMGKAKVLGLIVDRSKVDLTGGISITISSDDAEL